MSEKLPPEAQKAANDAAARTLLEQQGVEPEMVVAKYPHLQSAVESILKEKGLPALDKKKVKSIVSGPTRPVPTIARKFR